MGVPTPNLLLSISSTLVVEVRLSPSHRIFPRGREIAQQIKLELHHSRMSPNRAKNKKVLNQN